MRARVIITLALLVSLTFGVPRAATAQSASFLRGDADASGTIELTDGIYILGHLFLGYRTPVCMDAADVNDSGAVDLSDAVYLFGWLFLGGQVPPSPGPTTCGPDPTEDELSCIYFQPCDPPTGVTEALMVLVGYESTDGLANFAFECQKRGIRPVVLAKAAFVTENCDLFKALARYGVEIVGWCGPLLWGMPEAEQREMVLATKQAIETCTGSPLKAISTRLFGTDATTCRIADELGIPYVLARGTTGARATVYKPAEHDVKLISISNMETSGWAGGSLSDWSIWSRDGTPADFRAQLQNARRHDRITPVTHARIGGLKKAWMTVFREQVLDNTHVHFSSLDEFAATIDATLPLAKIPENRANPYGPFEEIERVPVDIQVTESRQDAEALEQVMDELEARGIHKTTVFVRYEMAQEHCPLLQELRGRGHEIAAFVRHENELGEKVLLEDMTRAEQEAVIGEVKTTFEGCLGSAPAGFRSSQFSQNQDTNEILAELGFDWHASFVRGRNYLPGHGSSFSPFWSFDYGFFVVTMIGAEVVEGEISALCDTALEGDVESAEHWSQVVKGYFNQHREAGMPFVMEFHPYFLADNEEYWPVFLELAAWLGQQDAEFLTTAEFIERCTNQYGPAAAPAVPYRDEPNVDKLWTIADFPEVPGTPTVGNRIIFYHNGQGPMCLAFLEFLETIDYPLEEHLNTEAGFWNSLQPLEQEFGRSEGVSEVFGYFPIIFVKTKAYSGYNSAIGDAIRALIAE